ncbi:Transcriptional regulatory protein dep1 [Cytospora mali]|uniref:Transcriptional regulatory protein dep1 n=1 Tax=Cytospora mali TaxID=578113 RepID=A0A194VQT6_CYTMA|nr:Transcriptional regulatory protein dep1 [Valsa mali]
MATGGTAPPIAMANPPHSLLDQDSNVSSPLSEVEDKDADPDDMDIDMHSNHTDGVDPLDSGKGRAQGPAHEQHDDSESNLSDIETNDSEAETERLYDTPRKNNTQGGNIKTITNDEPHKSPVNSNRTFQRSPSKLQSQVRAGLEAETGDEDNDDLTDERHDADDEDKSFGYNEADSDEEERGTRGKAAQLQRNKSQESHIVASSTLAGSLSDNSSADSRKRKRSPVVVQTTTHQPTRKRAGSILETADDSSSLSKVMSEDVAPDNSTGNKSADQTADEDEENLVTKDAEDVADSVEKPPSETVRPKKSKRNSTKRRKGSEDAAAEAHDAEGPAAAASHTADEHVEPEVDEEAEAAHRNEEEMEKKRNAFDHLSSIEKNFAILRDRLYEERLAQLNEEEAMLTSDNPTHPEYLAMMQCIDSRRVERLRVADVEYKLNMTALDRWAVARRAQILTQYFQSARETRERYIDDLGREWYEIQHERRRVANPIPDYGFRFPKTKLEQKRHAVAHSKEVSILAGIAQHQGFPAAPDMKGATSAELEEDFEAMARARQGAQPIGVAQRIQPALQEYATAPFGQGLGPAGQEYIENHPWANPKHPSHGPASRRHSHSTYAGPPALMGHARAPHQPSGPMWFANGQLNGDAAGRRHPTVAADPEPAHVRKAVEAVKSKREAVV